MQLSALGLSFNTGNWHPFEKVGDSYDYSRINTDYFDHATELLKTALDLIKAIAPDARCKSSSDLICSTLSPYLSAALYIPELIASVQYEFSSRG